MRNVGFKSVTTVSTFTAHLWVVHWVSINVSVRNESSSVCRERVAIGVAISIAVCFCVFAAPVIALEGLVSSSGIVEIIDGVVV